MAGYIGSKASVVSSGAERKKTFTITGATTSLTGLNYTVGKVHVFQNGVRLVDGTDYTATNGTTITLTVAAQSGDNVVVISQAAFQVADLPAGTPSINDNGNATAITIDSSENVFVGKTSAGLSTAGVQLDATGSGGFCRAETCLTLSRLSTDGSILDFRKDSTTVGSTGVVGGNDLYIAGGATGIRFDSDVAKIYPTNGTGAVSNGAVDIGEANFRFKDAYLSGGVYLGGTGSANHLDDYESGSFTPTVLFGSNNSGTTYSSLTGGSYTKIGNVVQVTGRVRLSSKGSGAGTVAIAGLPFAANQDGGLGITFIQNTGSYLFQRFLFLTIDITATKAFIRLLNSSGNFENVQEGSITSSFDVIFSGTYKTNS